jgi:hypothetical protein
MDTDLKVDIAALHAAIVSDIKAKFPALKTVEFYRVDRKTIPLPACLLELVDMEYEPLRDDGTGQAPMRARFEAELILGMRDSSARLNVRVLAGAMAAFIKTRRWTGILGDACELIGCYPDDFSPELDQYEIQKVEWTQLIYLGDTYWTDDGITPENVFVGVAPNIGHGHEADYVQVAP